VQWHYKTILLLVRHLLPGFINFVLKTNQKIFIYTCIASFFKTEDERDGTKISIHKENRQDWLLEWALFSCLYYLPMLSSGKTTKEENCKANSSGKILSAQSTHSF